MTHSQSLSRHGPEASVVLSSLQCFKLHLHNFYRRCVNLFASDPSVMFHASLSCGNLLLSTSLDGRSGERMTVMKMLREGRTLMAIATLMYAPVPLEEVRIN